MLTVVPTSVCGREKRQSVFRAASNAAGTLTPTRVLAPRIASAPLQPPGAYVQNDADRHEGRTGEGTGCEAQQAPCCPWLAHILDGARGSRGRPGRAGAAGDREGIPGLTGAAPPWRHEPELLDLLEARSLEPAAVLGLRRKEHPGVRHEARHAAPRRQRAHDEDGSAGPHHPVCLGDRASWVGPVFDAAAGDVSVE